MTKRGVNLGCGTHTLPCEQPPHHRSIPAELYEVDSGIEWHNVDINRAPGVTHIENLMAYPWALDSDAYDYAICSHLVEHIPHEIVWNGRDWGTFGTGEIMLSHMLEQLGGIVIPQHPVYQNGWFAWFGELFRIMKPGGKAYILTPYAFSSGGVSDPTHTRYVTPQTFGYFNTGDDFTYRSGQAWKVEIINVSPTYAAAATVQALLNVPEINEHIINLAQNIGQHRVDGISEFTVCMEAVKDGAES